MKTTDPVTNVRPLGDHDILEAVELLVAEQSTILHGMKDFLRDYFAGQAISGLIVTTPQNQIAEKAYKIADAMMEARKR